MLSFYSEPTGALLALRWSGFKIFSSKKNKRVKGLPSLSCDRRCFVCSAHGSRRAHTPTFLLPSVYKQSGTQSVRRLISGGCVEAMPTDLKTFLESSLNEIFKTTVSDILESVDRTLSEYQGKIQRIESENHELRRRLIAQRSGEPATGGTVVNPKHACVKPRSILTATSLSLTFSLSMFCRTCTQCVSVCF